MEVEIECVGLPPECWVLVFKQLQHLALLQAAVVCKIWRRIVFKDVLKYKWQQNFVLPYPEDSSNPLLEWSSLSSSPFKKLLELITMTPDIDSINLYHLTFTQTPQKTGESIYKPLSEFDQLTTMYNQLMTIKDSRNSIDKVLHNKLKTSVRKAIDALSPIFEQSYQLTAEPLTVYFLGQDDPSGVLLNHISIDGTLHNDIIVGINITEPFIEEISRLPADKIDTKFDDQLACDQDIDYYDTVDYIKLKCPGKYRDYFSVKWVPLNLSAIRSGLRLPRLAGSLIVNYHDVSKLIKTLAPFGYNHWRHNYRSF